MAKHLYDDGKLIHACEKTTMHPGVVLVWTMCGKDVPANSSFMGNEVVTCEKCKQEGKGGDDA